MPRYEYALCDKNPDWMIEDTAMDIDNRVIL